MSRGYTFLLLLSSIFYFTGCNSNKIVDQYQDLNDGLWHVDSLASFDFEIEDTTSTYKVSYNVRYAGGYPYYNLYVSYYLEDSSSNSISSDLQDLILFDKKTGEPLGEGLGDMFDREILIFDKMKFPYPGSYAFKVKQFMRIEELPGIMSFGLKIEKVEEG